MNKIEKNKVRAHYEDEMLDKAFRQLAASVTGRYERKSVQDEKEAMKKILTFLHQKDSTGISSRKVILEGTWYKQAVGPYLGETIDGQPVAILPDLGGYTFFDEKTGKKIRINKKTSSFIKEEALCFYVSLPDGKLGVKDLYLYMLKSLAMADYLRVVGAVAMATIIAMTIPVMTKLVFSGLIPSKSYELIWPVLFLMITAMVSNYLIQIIRTFSIHLVNVRAGASLQAAGMERVMRMPTGFFREYSSGELTARLGSIDRLTAETINAVVSSGLTGVFSLIYLIQIHAYAPSLLLPAVVVLFLQMLLSFAGVAIGVKRANERLQKESRLSGFLMSILNGIQKIRLSGGEKRVFTKWAKQYKEVAELEFQPPKILLYNKVFSSFVSMIGLVAFYYLASVNGVTQADYMAFNSAYGIVAGAFASLTGIVTTIADFGPMLNMMKPILETEPESEAGKIIPGELTGNISLSHVSFRYHKDGPMILDDICLDIRQGEYIGIVGTTGCGKSTLLRLLLGFESPDQGAVYYDGKDLSTMNLRSVRQKIGTVLQNGQLIQGTIFTNLMIAYPELTEKEAWEALELAALAEDVRRMPMKLQTVLSENGGGLSGGQKQRLLIARALVKKPNIVFMDEATSALDNVAQAHTVRSLDGLHCTRVVIAHRLSTIQNCSRILMLEGGKIVEEGTYQTLIEKGGRFAALVERQRLEM